MCLSSLQWPQPPVTVRNRTGIRAGTREAEGAKDGEVTTVRNQ